MKRLLRTLLMPGLAASTAILGLSSLTGCSSNTAAPTVVKVVAASGLKALSADATSIKVVWTRDASDLGVDTVQAESNGAPVVVTSTGKSATLTGLTAGVEYRITVRNSAGSSPALTWMTAVRTNNIRIYQVSAAGMPNALLLGPGGAKAVSVQTPPGTADFVLDDNTNHPQITSPSGLSFEAASQFDPALFDASIDTVPHFVYGGLDNDYASAGYTDDRISMVGNAYYLPNDAGYTAKGSRVLIVRTHDDHLAKIEIVAQASGMLYGLSGQNKFVILNVSYQVMPGEPYASRPHLRYGARVPRVVIR